jgi:hypothetical protein
MRFLLIYLQIMVTSILLSAGIAGAIDSVVPAPNPAQVGQNVTVTIRTVIPAAAAACTYDINFGDGSVQNTVPIGTCVSTPPSFTCTQTVNHAYASAGNWNINVNPSSMACGSAAAAVITVGGFSIQRMELFFTNNRRGETTVRRNEAGLRAAASILYSGSGLLQGRWEIDGRVIGRVFQHLTFGGALTLEMPAGITLPTFDPGSHTVQLIIENPTVAFRMPVLVYFVTPDEAPGPIRLMLPRADDVIPYGPARFEWEGSSAASIYLVRFLKRPENAQIFSAYTAYPYYPLKETALRLFFASGGSYLWEVLALDDKGNPVAVSKQAGFAFRGP